MNQLAELCIHKRLEAHEIDPYSWEKPEDGCPGGRLLPADALKDRIRRSLLRSAGEVASDGSLWLPDIAAATDAILDALAASQPERP
jgi:hypothetical protein